MDIASLVDGVMAFSLAIVDMVMLRFASPIRLKIFASRLSVIL